MMFAKEASVVGTPLLMSTHNISFHGEVRKNIYLILPFTWSYETENVRWFLVYQLILTDMQERLFQEVHIF